MKKFDFFAPSNLLVKNWYNLYQVIRHKFVFKMELESLGLKYYFKKDHS